MLEPRLGGSPRHMPPPFSPARGSAHCADFVSRIVSTEWAPHTRPLGVCSEHAAVCVRRARSSSRSRLHAGMAVSLGRTRRAVAPLASAPRVAAAARRRAGRVLLAPVPPVAVGSLVQRAHLAGMPASVATPGHPVAVAVPVAAPAHRAAAVAEAAQAVRVPEAIRTSLPMVVSSGRTRRRSRPRSTSTRVSKCSREPTHSRRESRCRPVTPCAA